MNSFILAVPSQAPGGLDAAMSAHFGHCDVYTLVEIIDNKAHSVKTVPPVPHEKGGCLAAVEHLADPVPGKVLHGCLAAVEHLAGHGVGKLLAGGMGMRPLTGFQQAGIEVYHVAEPLSVGQAVQAFLDGRLRAFGTELTCRGGCH